jgi:hypothetical protein
MTSRCQFIASSVCGLSWWKQRAANRAKSLRNAAKLTAVREGKIRRLIINLPPRHLKSLMASIAFPAWCLGHDPSAQILCVSYAQDLADKLARDCRSIMISPWYGRIFPTRLSAHPSTASLSIRRDWRHADERSARLPQ